MGNLVAVIATLVALVAVLVSFQQMRKSEFIAHGALLSEILAYLYSEHARATRAVVWQLDSDDFADWTKDQLHAAEEVGRCFNRIGFLMRNGYLDSKELLEWWGLVVIKTYRITVKSIESRRERDGDEAHFIYYEWLAREAVVVRKRNAWYVKRKWAETKVATGGQFLEVTSDDKEIPDGKMSGLSTSHIAAEPDGTKG